jgi:hypothetical protein
MGPLTWGGRRRKRMGELHWTGAAILLALALLGSPTARSRRATIVSFEDFARERGLALEPRRVPDDVALRERRVR